MPAISRPTDEVYDAAFRRAGMLRVRNIDWLFDAAEALGRIKPFNGERLAIVTNGRGMGYLAIDHLLDLGGKLADISPATREALEPLLTIEGWSGAPPWNWPATPAPNNSARRSSLVLQDKSNDAVMAMHSPNILVDGEEVARAAVEAVKKHRKATIISKPVFAVWYGADEEISKSSTRRKFRITSAARSPASCTWSNGDKAREALMVAPPSLPVDFAPNTTKARAIVQQAISRGHAWLAPVEISALLEAYDIPIAPAGWRARRKRRRKSRRLVLGRYGGCVVKIMSRDIVHKSDLGGVALDLRSASSRWWTPRARCWIAWRSRRRMRGWMASPSIPWCAVPTRANW